MFLLRRFIISIFPLLLGFSVFACLTPFAAAQSTDSETPVDVAVEQEEESTALPELTIEMVADDTSDVVEAEPLSPFPQRISLEEVNLLIEQGMDQLAYSSVLRERENYEFSDEWVEWERLFFEIAQKLGNWEDIHQRSIELAESIPYEFYSDMQKYAIRANLNLGNIESAMTGLRHLIWELPYDKNNMIDWRDLLVQTYIAEGSLDEAQIAMTSYYRDYRPSAPEWEHRYARILFATGYSREALSRVASLQTTESKLLVLYSDYESGLKAPSEVVQAGLSMVPEFSNRSDLEEELWVVIAAAAQGMNDLETRVTAIENSLSVQRITAARESRVWVVERATEDLLLSAYADLAVSVGNDFNLVIGDDRSWFGLAQEFDITAPVIARSIYSFLARQTSDPEAYKASVLELGNNLDSSGMTKLMYSLFVEPGYFDASAVLPSVRTKLANRAIRLKELDTALSIIESSDEPENPEELFTQLLRRARIAVVTKDYVKAFDLIGRMIENIDSETHQVSIDRIIHVVFDLQNSGIHEFAITLFKNLYDKTSDFQIRREILRWVSESLAAQQKNIEASEMLLRSARLGDKWDDSWGRSARLQAADELANSELYDDARVLYEELRESEIDPRSKALIANRLQNLPN